MRDLAHILHKPIWETSNEDALEKIGHAITLAGILEEETRQLDEAYQAQFKAVAS